jgi:hypothetical protein
MVEADLELAKREAHMNSYHENGFVVRSSKLDIPEAEMPGENRG